MSIATRIAIAQARDVLDATSFADPVRVRAGDFADLDGARVVVLAAGTNERPGESRLDLLSRNAKVFAEIICAVLPLAARRRMAAPNLNAIWVSPICQEPPDFAAKPTSAGTSDGQSHDIFALSPVSPKSQRARRQRSLPHRQLPQASGFDDRFRALKRQVGRSRARGVQRPVAKSHGGRDCVRKLRPYVATQHRQRVLVREAIERAERETL